jgi:hypothetical protein
MPWRPFDRQQFSFAFLRTGWQDWLQTEKSRANLTDGLSKYFKTL